MSQRVLRLKGIVVVAVREREGDWDSFAGGREVGGGKERSNLKREQGGKGHPSDKGKFGGGREDEEKKGNADRSFVPPCPSAELS